MYHPDVIARNVATWEAALGLPLTRYPVEVCRKWVKHLDGKYDLKKGEWLEPLSEIEERFVINERAMCASDFQYWVNRYHHIKDKRNNVVLCQLNLAQKITLSVIAGLEKQGIAVFIMSLKARQLGITTLAQAIIEHRKNFKSHTGVVTGSASVQKSRDMVEKAGFSYNLQPDWLKPAIVRFKTGESYQYANGATVTVQAGNQESDMARGSTPTCAHLSEVASYENCASLLDAGLFKALHRTSEAFCILESTAEGDTGWWYRTWHYNVSSQATNDAMLFPLFLPWYIGEDLYPTPEYIIERGGIPASWKPCARTSKHAASAAAYVKSSPVLRKHLGAEWEMPREQQWYWEKEFQAHKKRRELQIFFQEMPASVAEAFQASGESIFDAEILAEVRDACRPPRWTFALRGAEIPARFQPRSNDVDERHKPIPLTIQWEPDAAPVELGLVPLLWRPEMSPQNKLLLWEWPQSDQTYAVGVDVSDGLGEERSDNSCIQVLKKGDFRSPEKQVAEFVSASMSGLLVWPYVAALLKLFTVRVFNAIQEPMAVIEVNREGGRNLQEELLRRGYNNFYIHQRTAASGRSEVQGFGWQMTQLNRANMIEWLSRAVHEQQLLIHSTELAGELGTLVKWPDNKVKAARGKHDDRAITAGIVLSSFYESIRDEARSNRRNPFTERQRVYREDELYPKYQPPQVGVLPSLGSQSESEALRRAREQFPDVGSLGTFRQ